MTSLIRAELEKIKGFPGFIMDICKIKQGYTIRIYRDNYEEFADTKRTAIGLRLSEAMRNLRAAGIDNIWLEVYEHAPKGRR